MRATDLCDILLGRGRLYKNLNAKSAAGAARA
jgi:hypothetical protein